jgi:hypothetical protein
MSIAKTFTQLSVISVGLAVAGCASTQSASFRQMTAADHEHAARTGQDSTGASSAEHRAAAQDLRETEQFACAGVPEIDRDEGPFAQRDRIASVEVVRDRVFPKAPTQPFGIVVYIRATPGLTEQWLGRVIQCHVAHHAVVGASGVEESSPLLTGETQIHVSSTGAGFRVSITSSDIDVARQLVRKGRALSANAS